jgi:oxygen-independent coproporphyrinogen III oxidase
MSKHNWLYWSNGKYLGIGPSAHSYDGGTRQWNTSNLNNYLKNVAQGGGYFEIEKLTENNKFNEYILTSLRTNKGVSERYVKSVFNEKIITHFIKVLHELFVEGFMDKFDNSFVLNKKGIFILDFLVKKFYYN